MSSQHRSPKMLRGAMACAVLFSLAACSPSDEDAGAIKASANGLAEAWRTKNAQGVLSYMNDGVMVMAPGSPAMHGRQEVARYVQWAAADPRFSMNMQVDAVGRSGNLGYSRGRFILKSPAPGSDQISTMTGSFVSVFKRGADGKWTVVEDISSPN